MPRVCQISGKKTSYGNRVSHSHRSTRRSFKVNLIKKWIYVSHENAWRQMTVSARMIKSLNKKGLISLMKKYKQNPKMIQKAKVRKIGKPSAKRETQST